jgi:hypothetical protein
MESIGQAAHGRDHIIGSRAHLVNTGPTALADEVIARVDNARPTPPALHIISNGLVGHPAIRRIGIGNGARHDDAVAGQHLVDLTWLHQQF